MSKNVEKRVRELEKKVLYYQNLYYKEGKSEISDQEFDKLFDELSVLEKEFPQYKSENSPTTRVGSDLDSVFKDFEHHEPVLSLDKAYSTEEILSWLVKTVNKTGTEKGFVIEEKIDGLSVVLYYKDGALIRGVTRGDGFKGNDLTGNIRTVRDIPLKVSDASEFSVRGEIFLEISGFRKLNEKSGNNYSNPRNLASGALRNIKSSSTASVPLRFFAYELNGEKFRNRSHIENLMFLSEAGFVINRNFSFVSDEEKIRKHAEKLFPDNLITETEKVADHIAFHTGRRQDLDYEIDGLVLKMNDTGKRADLGSTAHHPRWAIAYKFDSPVAQTSVKEINVQVGRNGRITPVALLEPVFLAGSTVMRATLHNQEYIDSLGLNAGDFVEISKRGDVIPAVERVIKKGDKREPFLLPENCPFCNHKISLNGAHNFCTNTRCPERMKRRIIHFASRKQMDIETLGEKTIGFLFDRGFIREIPDLYKFDYTKLIGMEGFKEKKVQNIIDNIEESKSHDFTRVLFSLGFEGLGPALAKDLVRGGFNTVDSIIESAKHGNSEDFLMLNGVGDTYADLLVEHFSDEDNLRMIDELRKAGLGMEQHTESSGEELIFRDQIWVITGSFDNYKPRSLAGDEIEKRGGKVSSAVSSKTTHLLAGRGAGSKLTKAEKLGIQVIDEQQFLTLISETSSV